MNSTDNLIECLNTDKCNNLTTRNPHSFCVKKRPAQNVQKIMTLIVTVDCLIVFSYLISKIRVQGWLLMERESLENKHRSISQISPFLDYFYMMRKFFKLSIFFVQKLINVNHLLMKNCDLFFAEHIFGKFLFKVVIIFLFS